MESRIIHGLKVVEVQPGAPLPPGVPAEAVRCELAEGPRYSPRERWMAVAMGVLGALGSIVLKLATGWGTAFLLLSLGLLYRALFASTVPSLTPAPNGRYVAFEPPVHADSGIEGAERFASLVLGGVAIGGAGIAMYTGHSSFAAVAIGAVGCFLLYVGVKGFASHGAPEGRRPPLWFQTLANPALPLPDDALVSGTRGPTLPLPDQALSPGEGGREVSTSPGVSHLSGCPYGSSDAAL